MQHASEMDVFPRPTREEEILTAWERVQEVGATDIREAIQFEQRVTIAGQRVGAWRPFADSLRQFREQPCEANDQRLVERWAADVFDDWDWIANQRTHVEEANRRLGILNQIKQLVALQATEPTYPNERQLVKLRRDSLPTAYQFDLEKRIDIARARVLSADSLTARTRCPTSQEESIVQAWESIVKLGAESMVEDSDRQRVETAQQRIPHLAKLREIHRDQLLNDYDREMLAHWNELLSDCDEATSWKKDHANALHRQRQIKKLFAAVRDQLDHTILEISVDPLLQGYSLDEKLKDALKDTLDVKSRWDAFLAALAREDREEFVQLFDARLVRRCSHLLAAQGTADRAEIQAKLLSWTRELLRSTERLRLARHFGRSVLRNGSSLHHAIWRWPNPRFAEKCIVGVCEDVPSSESEPRQMKLMWEQEVEARTYTAGEMGLAISENLPSHAFVVVWAVIDLGFSTVISEPVNLGRLE